MAPRAPQDNNDNQDDQDSEGTQRPRPQTRLRTASTDSQSDDDTYEPSNDGNQEPEENRGDTLGKIYALDYVSKDHPLLPLPRVRILDSADALKNRTRKHPEFWWDVFTTMQERVQPNHSQGPNDALRGEIARLKKENDKLRREGEQDARTKESLTAELEKANKKLERLDKERDQDKVIIDYLQSEQRRSVEPNPPSHDEPLRHRSSEPRISQRVDDPPLHGTTEIPEINTIRRTTTRYPSTLPVQPHNNPKFPDAPMFSGDRATFDSWKDKVYDKLHNSIAQYPTDYHQIAYVKSRTEGVAYQQIRAQCQPGHARAFQTADEVLHALEKVYGDKNRRTRAINEMRTLKMGRRSFDDFYTDFARCAAEIGHSDDALIPLLENAISDELVGKVIGLQKPSDYYDLVDFYREIDHQMREHDKRVSSRLRTSRFAPSTDQTKISRSNPNGAFKSEGYRPNPAERALLAQHGRCYKCGEHGHRIGDCTKPQMQEMPRLFARTANKLNKVTVDSDDDETVVEGKEES